MLFCSSTIFPATALLLAAPFHAATAKKYDDFQALGFSINTAPANLCYNGLCEPAIDAVKNNKCDESDQITLTFPGAAAPTPGIVALDMNTYTFCMKVDVDGIPWGINPECKCSAKTNSCEMGLGLILDDRLGQTQFTAECYMGKENDLQDALDRIEIMKTAINKAFEFSNKDSSVLKIFNAPEFFFRGRKGAYKTTMDDILTENTPIFSIGKELTSFVSDPKYNDFLFLFGTIIVDTEDSSQGDDGLQEYQNFALLVEGGAEGARFLIPKRYVSIVDFLSGNRKSSIVGDAFLESDATGDPLYSNNIFLALKSKLEGEPYNLATIENNWFELYGIYFSIEVCLDHRFAVAMLNSSPTLLNGDSTKWRNPDLMKPQFQADISLVTSAGMNIKNDNVITKKGGNFFLQDGADGGDITALTEVWSAMNPVITDDEIKWEHDNPLEFGQVVPVYSEADVEIALKDLFPFLNVGGSNSSSYTPSIKMTPPVPIKGLATESLTKSPTTVITNEL